VTTAEFELLDETEAEAGKRSAPSVRKPACLLWVSSSRSRRPSGQLVAATLCRLLYPSGPATPKRLATSSRRSLDLKLPHIRRPSRRCSLPTVFVVTVTR
jgi:hypothetical protein